MNKRIEYIDALRGFTMLLVVMGHVLTHGLQNYTESSLCWNFFAVFRMPMFFFISGFIAYKKKELWEIQLYGKMLRKKAIVQLIPTFIFYFLYSIVFGLDIKNDFLCHGVGIYWFCQALFEMLLVYYTIQLICRYTKCNLCIPLLVIVSLLMKSVNLIWNDFFSSNTISQVLLIPRVFPYFFYFCIGIIIRKYSDYFFLVLKNDTFNALLIVSFFCLFILKYRHDFPLGYYLNTISEKGIMRLVALFSVFSFFYKNADYFSKNGRLSRILQFIGRRTLDIYLLHYFFIPDLSVCESFFSDNSRFVLELIFSLVVASFIILCSICCSQFIRNSEFLGHYLFGAKSNKYRW